MDEANVRALSVEQWHALATSGQTVAVRIQVNGDSMRPLIRRQLDYVTIIPMDRPPRPGDIVLFPGKRLGGDYVLHRVWKVEGRRMLTLGDGCLTLDGWMDAGAAWGRVTRIERGRLTIDPNRPFWRAAAWLWMGLYPVRGRLLFPKRVFRAVRREGIRIIRFNRP